MQITRKRDSRKHPLKIPDTLPDKNAIVKGSYVQ